MLCPWPPEEQQVMSPNHCSPLRTSLREQGLLGKAEADACSGASYSRCLGRRLFHALLSQQWAVLVAIIEGIGRPLTVVVGGAYSMDKLHLIEILIDQVNEIIICGCVAYTFLRLCSRAFEEENPTEVGTSDRVWQLVKRAKTVGCKLTLPVDWVYCSGSSGEKDVERFASECGVPNNWTGMDCGEQSQRLFAESVRQAGAVVCFGPTGTLEQEQFRGGTKAMLVAMAELQASGRVTVLADCGLEAAEKEWNMEAFECRAEAAVVQVRREDVHSVGSKDGGRTRPDWPQVGVDLACGEPVGCDNKVTPSQRAADKSREVYTLVDPSTPNHEVPSPTDPAYNPSANESSASLSGLEAEDTRMKQRFASASVKQDNKRNVVGLLADSLGFRPPDSNEGFDVRGVVKSGCSSMLRCEGSHREMKVPSSEGGLITHPAQGSTDLEVASCDVRSSPSTNDEWRYGVRENVGGLSPREGTKGSCGKRGSAKWLSFSGHVDLAQAPSQSSCLSLMRDAMGCSPSVQSGFCPSERRPCELRVAGSVQAAMPVVTVQTEAPGVLGKVQSFSGTLDKDVHQMPPMAGHGGSNHVQGKGLITKSAAVTLSPHSFEDSVENLCDRFHSFKGKKQGFAAVGQASNVGLREAVAAVRSQDIGMTRESQATWPGTPEQCDELRRVASVAQMPEVLLDASRCTRSLPNWARERGVSQCELAGSESGSRPRHESPSRTLSGLDPRPQPACDLVCPSRTLSGLDPRPQPACDLVCPSRTLSGLDPRPQPACDLVCPSRTLSGLDPRPQPACDLVCPSRTLSGVDPEPQPAGDLAHSSRIPVGVGPTPRLEPVRQLSRCAATVVEKGGVSSEQLPAGPVTGLQGVERRVPSGNCYVSEAHAEANANPSRKPIGFSPERPEVEGFPGGDANLNPSHKPLRFSQTQPQVQGFSGTEATSVNTDVNLGPIRFSPPAVFENRGEQVPGIVSNQVAAQVVGHQATAQDFEDEVETPGRSTQSVLDHWECWQQDGSRTIVCNSARGCPVEVHHCGAQSAAVHSCAVATHFDPVSQPLQPAVSDSAVPEYLDCVSSTISPDSSPIVRIRAVDLSNALSISGSRAPVGEGGLSDGDFEVSDDVGTTLMYQIFSDDEADGPGDDSDLDPCWTQSWAHLCVSSSGSRHPAPSILSQGPSRSVPQMEARGSQQVTWQVPLEIPCTCLVLDRTDRRTLATRSFPHDWSVKSKVQDQGCVFLSDLAGNFLRRLLVSCTGQAQARRSSPLPGYGGVISIEDCWKQLPSPSVSTVSPAPSMPRSGLCLVNKMPRSMSISGHDGNNVLLQACVKARWGETSIFSSSDINCKNSLSAKPGQDSSPKFLRYGASLPCADKGAAVQDDEVGFKQQMQTAAILYNHPNPRSLWFSPASPSVVMVSNTAAGAQASGAIFGPSAQFSEVQAGEVHLSQQVCSHPEVLTGKVHLSQQACSQPEAQAGEVHLSQQVCSHPEVQAGDAYLSQQACSQPEVQASEAHSSQCVYLSQLGGKVSNVRLSQGASRLVAQASQAQTGQKDLSRGVEDGQVRAEQMALSGVQVQGIRVPEHSTSKPVRFSPLSGVSLRATGGILYPLGDQQAAGKAARAWRVTGYPYYTKVRVRSYRQLPPNHRRLGLSPQHDPRGAVQDPVGFNPQRDLCKNVPNHSRTRLSSPGAIPGKTLTAVCQVSGAVSSVMPQVSGAVSSAVPQVSRAVSGAMPQASGAHQDKANHMCSVQGPTGRSIAHKDQVSRPDARVHPGDSTGPVLSPESLGFSSSSPQGRANKQGKEGCRTSLQDWLGPGSVQEWKYNNVISLLGIAQVSTTFGVLIGADVKSWRALSLTSIVAMFRATGIVQRNVLPGMHSTKTEGASDLSAGLERFPDEAQVCRANQAHLSICAQVPTSTGAVQVQSGTHQANLQPYARHSEHSPLPGLQASGEKRSRQAFPLITAPQFRGVGNEEAENLVRHQVQHALNQVGFAATQASLVTELLIQESFADILAVVDSEENLVEFAATVGQLPCRGMNDGQWFPEPIGSGGQSAVPIGSSEVNIEKELGRFEPIGKDGVGELQHHFLEPEQPSEVKREHDHPSLDGDASSPGLVWFILLEKGKLSSFISASPSMCNLLSSNELLSTLGWALGVLEAYKADKESLCHSGEIASPRHHQLATPGVTRVPLSSAPACKHYLKGFCNRGQYCKYSHEAGIACPEMEEALQRTAPATATAVKVCPHFLKGNCLRGRSCGYVHTQNAVVSLDADTSLGKEQPAQEIRVRCPHFTKGFCRRGESCGFAHVLDGPSVRDVPPQPEAGKRVKHPPLAQSKKERLREAGLLDVCFRWAQGCCEDRTCKYSHRPLGILSYSESCWTLVK